MSKWISTLVLDVFVDFLVGESTSVKEVNFLDAIDL